MTFGVSLRRALDSLIAEGKGATHREEEQASQQEFPKKQPHSTENPKTVPCLPEGPGQRHTQEEQIPEPQEQIQQTLRLCWVNG